MQIRKEITAGQSFKKKKKIKEKKRTGKKRCKDNNGKKMVQRKSTAHI